MKPGKLVAGVVAIAIMITVSLITPTAAGIKHDGKAVRFTVRVENISDKDGQTAADGSKWPFALSPGLYVMHHSDVKLFREGRAAMPNGLEAQAEDGNPAMLGRYIANELRHTNGIFNTPLGASAPAPILPGQAYQFSFVTTPGAKLTLITMFGQSNDWFYAPEQGIELFDASGMPVSGDITPKFFLYDAGTEKDEEPGVGPNQAPRQKGANTGAAQNGVVHKATESSFFNRTAQLLRVTVTPQLDESL
ncbi:MAG TPA: spondin domain-containing protein [Blastocatellia bacterium]|nr:spondin domain-containing protein [Blastocatellia bacterium]